MIFNFSHKTDAPIFFLYYSLTADLLLQQKKNYHHPPLSSGSNFLHCLFLLGLTSTDAYLSEKNCYCHVYTCLNKNVHIDT